MSTSTSRKAITLLGSDFAPREKDVIVGRGKVCYKHPGNVRLAKIVKSVLGTYSEAEDSKKSKTDLIKRIVSQVRESSPNGGFVKFDAEAGQWYEVGDRTAREKVSQTFRDCLTDHYKSSATSKTLRRRQERINRKSSVGSKSSSGSSVRDFGHAVFTSLQSPPLVSSAATMPIPKQTGLPLRFPSAFVSPLPRQVSDNDYGLAATSKPSTIQLALAIEERKMSLDRLIRARFQTVRPLGGLAGLRFTQF